MTREAWIIVWLASMLILHIISECAPHYAQTHKRWFIRPPKRKDRKKRG